jgi:hypothetical protein
MALRIHDLSDVTARSLHIPQGKRWDPISSNLIEGTKVVLWTTPGDNEMIEFDLTFLNQEVEENPVRFGMGEISAKRLPDMIFSMDQMLNFDWVVDASDIAQNVGKYFVTFVMCRIATVRYVCTRKRGVLYLQLCLPSRVQTFRRAVKPGEFGELLRK